MKKKSSNIDMETHLDLLKTIPKKSAPDFLLDAILEKVEKNKLNFQISPNIIKICAAVFAIVFGSETVLLVKDQKKQSEKIAKIIISNNNDQYE